MAFNYNQVAGMGVEHGPWRPIHLGIYALSGIDIEIDGRDIGLERDHQFDCTVSAIEAAWDEGRIPSDEADSRLAALRAMMPISELEVLFYSPATNDPRIKDNQ